MNKIIGRVVILVSFVWFFIAVIFAIYAAYTGMVEPPTWWMITMCGGFWGGLLLGIILINWGEIQILQRLKNYIKTGEL